MEFEQGCCRGCGENFISSKLQAEVLKKAREKGLDNYLGRFELCTKCRAEVFAGELIGDRLEKVGPVGRSVERRREERPTVRQDERLGSTAYKSECFICNQGCDALVHVKDGKVIRVEGDPCSDVTKGTLCCKGLASKDLLYHPDRLVHPLKRAGKRGEDNWERISWDEALDTIAQKLARDKERYGPGSFAFLLGDALCIGGTSNMNIPFRFCDVYGTPNRVTPGSSCSEMKFMAWRYVTGRLYPLVSVPEGSRAMILWAHNPNHSQPGAVGRILRMKKNGGKLVVIDPRSTYFAQRADVHAQIRPGSDCALALALLNVVITEDLYDREFVENWTIGFDRLAEHVKDYSPEKIEEVTWVPAGTTRKIARLFATAKPASIIKGVNALDQHVSSFDLHRAIAMLEAITGNVDLKGGIIQPPFPNMNSLRLPEMVKESPLGSDEFPLFCGPENFLIIEAHPACLVDAILTGQPRPIKTMIVSAGNPAVCLPNSSKVKAALEALEFLVVMDTHMSETAELASIVLPAASFVERMDLCDQYPIIEGLPYFILRKKAIDPYFESWSDIKFWLELAKRMGYHKFFPWKDETEIFDYVLKPMGLTTRYLEAEKPEGVLYGSLEEKEYLRSGFPTSSGRVELYSELLEKLGFNPLPRHAEPVEGPQDAELFKEYPLILTTGSRLLPFYHSQHRDIPRLRQNQPEPFAEVHPDTAKRYNIEDGDMVVVETRRGKVEIRARVTTEIVPWVVNIPHGWAEANVNELTDDTHGDPVLGYPALKSLLCKMTRHRVL